MTQVAPIRISAKRHSCGRPAEVGRQADHVEASDGVLVLNLVYCGVNAETGLEDERCRRN
jgi:hypothetical protein